MEDIVVFIPFGYRHQFHCCDAKVFQVGDFFDDAHVGSRVFDLGAAVPGEASDVQFVDDGVNHGDLQRPIILPVKVMFDEVTERHVAALEHLTPTASAEGVGKRVDEDLGRVVEHTLVGNVCAAVEAIAVTDVPFRGDQEDMPDVAGAIHFRVQFQFVDLVAAPERVLKLDDQGYSCGMSGKDGKVDAVINDRCPPGRGSPCSIPKGYFCLPI